MERPENIELDKTGMWLVPTDHVSVAPEMEEAAALALNKIGEGEWDEAVLADVLADIATEGDLSGTGFDEDDLDALIAELSAPVLPSDDEDREIGDMANKHKIVMWVSEKTYDDWLDLVGDGDPSLTLESLLLEMGYTHD